MIWIWILNVYGYNVNYLLTFQCCYAVYIVRHLTSSDYYDNMLVMFDKVILENKDIVIIGDFNFNYTVDLDETLAINPVHYLENL